MTKPTQPSTEDLTALRDELRAEIRTAHETLTDLRRETKDARTLIPLLLDETFEAEVRKRLDLLGQETKEATDRATEKVFARFDALADLILEGRRKGRENRPSFSEMTQARAVIDAWKEG